MAEQSSVGEVISMISHFLYEGLNNLLNCLLILLWANAWDSIDQERPVAAI